MSYVHINFIVRSEEDPDLYKYIVDLRSNKGQAPMYRLLMHDGLIFRKLLGKNIKLSNTELKVNKSSLDKLKNNFK